MPNSSTDRFLAMIRLNRNPVITLRYLDVRMTRPAYFIRMRVLLGFITTKDVCCVYSGCVAVDAAN